MLNTDKGTQFTSARLVETLSRPGIAHRRIAYNHPEGNSLIEHFHRSLKEEELCSTNIAVSVKPGGWITRGLTEHNHDRPPRALRNQTPGEAREGVAQPQSLPNTKPLCV